MAVFNKPQYNTVWASNGVKLQPPDGKIAQGWVVEIPPYEYDNWVKGRQDSMLAHVNQFGIPVWDASTEYQNNRSYVQGPISGTIFRALRTHTGANPETDTSGAWQIAFNSSGDSLMKAYNLSDVPDKALARANLGITTTAQYDARYLLKSLNLSDVPDKALARNNLGITPDSVYDAKYLHRSLNLSDIVDKAAARANLGISETGQSGAEYLFKSANLSDLLDKPVSRTNLGVYAKTEVYSRSEIDALLPAGQVSYFAMQEAPEGWLIADGRAVPRLSYPKLFTAIGTLYGAGNGSTTFNLPDLRSEFIRGWDGGRGVDTGRVFGSYQQSTNLAHTHVGRTTTAPGHFHVLEPTTTSTTGAHGHTIVDPGHGHTILGSPGQGQGSGGGGDTVQQSAGTSLTNVVKTNITLNLSGNHSHTVAGFTRDAGSHDHGLSMSSEGGNEAKPRNIALLACIRY